MTEPPALGCQRRHRIAVALAALVASASASASSGLARAEPHVLRLATAAPEGTAWAQLLRQVAREVERDTHGDVKIKWYLGSIAGDEVQVGDRIRRDQLDGLASGGMICARLAPSMRVLGLLGLFQSRDESTYVLGRLRPTIVDEFQHNGFAFLGELAIGPYVVFSRAPITSMAALRRLRLWVWDLDDVLRMELPELGAQVVPLGLEAAGRAYEDGQIDAFLAVPSAALAFQWSAQARYVTELHMGVLTGCFLVANRALDALSFESQRAVRAAVARAVASLDAIGRAQDDALLGGLFARQGLRTVPASDSFRAEFFEAARGARDRLRGRLAPEELLLRVTSWLADYRADHPPAPAATPSSTTMAPTPRSTPSPPR